MSRPPKSLTDGCEEKFKLLHAYNDATRRFSDKVAALKAKSASRKNMNITSWNAASRMRG
jgi:hypothetical protein